ncbi:MAG TPA: restriction endonuclease [Candidatus Didemnitutus sp.]|nr:restriction endonuclease [Candidatus Didemnitutus sp.]
MTTPNAPAAPEAVTAATPANPTTVETTSASAATSAAAESTPSTVPVAPTPKPTVKHRVKALVTEGPAASFAEALWTFRTYGIAFVIVVGGVGYLIWRRRQRSLMLEATAVSRSPFAPEVTAGVAAAATGTRFTAELLNKLEWKRFEDLVAAYYNKTGVVATRTKMGPASAVHIRISWKGEQRPFACVECVPHPSGLIEPKVIQALVDVLAAEDIRRGYVVTPGKFSVPARDLAEEKHITLLSGDLFLEKLNALPEPARAELLRDVTDGDYVTPTCPSCESKMGRSTMDPSTWQCPQCSTTLPRG